MGSQDRRAQLEARNAAMRDKVDSLLAGLNRQTAALQAAQQQAAAVTGRVTSQDGLVTVTVNAAGVVTGVEFAPSAFTRSTPDKLARSVVAVAQQAAGGAREELDAALAPVRGNLPDLPDIFPGAPGIKDLVQPAPSRQAPRDDEDDDFSDNSVLWESAR